MTETNAVVVWTKSPFNDSSSSHCIYGGYAFMCGADGLHCFDLATGEQRWTAAGDCYYASPVICNGTLFFSVGSDVADICVMRAGPVQELMGKIAAHKSRCTTPAICDGRLLARTGDGGIIAYDVSGPGTGNSSTPHGVPYAWLTANGVTSNPDTVENSDPDGDGIPTWKEYFAGTDPNSKNSAFEVLSITANGTLEWYGTTNSGVTTGFKMYRCTNLLSGVWELVDGNISRSANGTNTWTDQSPPSSSWVFYRPAVPASTL
jgi:hypothetical protein